MGKRAAGYSLVAGVIILLFLGIAWSKRNRCLAVVSVPAEILSNARSGDVIPVDQWEAFRSAEGMFAVHFPASPRAVNARHYEMYFLASARDVVYSLGVFPDDGTPLADRIQDLGPQGCNTLLSSTRLKIGEEAVEYVIEDSKAKPIGVPLVHLRRVIRNRGKVYTIGATVPLGKSSAYQQFVDQFELTGNRGR